MDSINTSTNYLNLTIWNQSTISYFLNGNKPTLINPINATIDENIVTPTNTAATNNTDPLYIACRNNAGTIQGQLIGDIKEFIISQEIWDSNIQQKIEGYLAHKWNLTLPTGHPYKYNLPYL